MRGGLRPSPQTYRSAHPDEPPGHSSVINPSIFISLALSALTLSPLYLLSSIELAFERGEGGKEPQHEKVKIWKTLTV